MNLRGLDEKIVPALARGLARVLSPGRPHPSPPSPPAVAEPAPAPAPARRRPPGPWRARLASLDDRFARRGLLGHLRTTPLTAVTLTLALLVATALAAVHVAGHRSDPPVVSTAAPVAATPPAGCPVGTAAGSAYVGPALGADLPAYVTAQASTVARCATAAPGARLFAVISLTAAETPMQAAEALRGVSLQAVFVQLPATPGTPYLLPVSSASDGVVRVDAAIVGAYAAAQTTLLADRDERAAGQLRTGCACTYAAVAVGTVAQLAALRTSDVSVIALAPAGVAADGITARPLLPSETAVLDPSAAPHPLVAGSLP